MPALQMRPTASMAKPQVAKPAKVQKPNLAIAAVATFTAAAMLVAPATMAFDKSGICARIPTAKVCLKNSFKPADK